MMQDNYTSVPVLTSTEEGYQMLNTRSGPLNEAWMEIGIAGKPEELKGTRAAEIARAKFTFLPWMQGSERNQHKLLLDVDGWGWSARYRDLLWTGR